MKIRILALCVALLSLSGCALLNPTREHSIIKMARLFHPDDRVENHRNMDAVFPPKPVAASSAPQPFARAEGVIAQSYGFRGETRTLSDFIKRTTVTSLVVVRDGKLVSEQYFQGADANSRFTSWSVAKSFVATLVAIALHEGKIASLDEPLGRYIPELGGDAYAAVPIRAALQMASGVKFDETYVNQFSDINKYFYKVFLLGQGSDSAAMGYPKEVVPSTRFLYASTDTHMLAWLVRKVYGQSLAQVLEQKLWQPLGMESKATWNADSSKGAEIGFCCLNATARDFAKLGQLYLQDGVWNGRRLLPEGWVRMATRPTALWQEPTLERGERGYGLQFWVPMDYDGEYYANGVWGQSIWVDEKTKTVIVRTSVDQQYVANRAETFAVMRAISRGR